MSQAQLRDYYGLPATAFDIESWRVMPRFGRHDPGQHLVRYKLPVAAGASPIAWERDLVLCTHKKIPLYEVAEGALRTHDYSSPSWGHDYIYTPVDATKGRLTGWGVGIEAGDYIILLQSKRNRLGPTTRYLIDAIKYSRDPFDMWNAEVSFAPRSAEH